LNTFRNIYLSSENCSATRFHPRLKRSGFLAPELKNTKILRNVPFSKSVQAMEGLGISSGINSRNIGELNLTKNI
jgi:hypothetical protein